MKIFLAGNIGAEERLVLLYRILLRRLFSYFYKEIYNSERKIMKNKQIELFIDSGAFSAWTQKVEIDIKEYIAFIKKYSKDISVYANLDVIGSAEETFKNQKIMEKAGLRPLPCFHYGEPIKYLKKYLEDYEYIALGGMGGRKGGISLWMDDLFENYLTDSKGMPIVKVHAFGVTSLRAIMRYPWYSVDSTSWIVSSGLGFVYVPRYRSGKYIYDQNSWKVVVSSKSPDKKAGEHIEAFSPKQQEIIFNYFKSKGFSLGKSEYKFENEGYELKENEKFISKANENGKREVEIRIEKGLCNNYMDRDQLNAMYFLDLEKAIPKWPCPFIKKKTTGGFGLC